MNGMMRGLSRIFYADDDVDGTALFKAEARQLTLLCFSSARRGMFGWGGVAQKMASFDEFREYCLLRPMIMHHM